MAKVFNTNQSEYPPTYYNPQRNLRTNRYHFNSSGFTLIELLVITGIIAIVIFIAIPSFDSLFKKMESDKINRIIFSSLVLAKTQSYTYQRNVVLCLADFDNNCHKNATEQIIVFFDRNDNHQFDAPDDSFISQQALSLKYGATYLRTGGGRHYTRFSGRTGMPTGFIGHIKYCPNEVPSEDANSNAYLISFSQVGKITVKLNSSYPTECPYSS